MKISTVLLDADGVVQTTAPGWLDALGSLCGKQASRKAFLQDVFAAERPALIGAESFRPALAEVLERWGSPAGVEEAIRIWQMIEPQEIVLEEARCLRRSGVNVSLATNQQAERAAFMSKSLAYEERFDDLFYSCELGYAKPSEAYFGAALETLEQPPAQVLFVDDNAANVEAAQSVGLHARTYDLRTGREGFRALLAEFGLGGY
jgi:putative hydrolase of the HAD superfamily